jgi:YYY domain-containing protein
MLALLDIKTGTGSINEFPYFTFLFADLHAHLIGLPLTLLVLALCVNILKARGSLFEDPLDSLRRASSDGGSAKRALAAVAPAIAFLLVAGLAVGALYPTNSWDYPTYVGILAVALLVPWYASSKRSGRGLIGRLGALAVIVILSQLLYRPFSANFQSFYSGVHLSDEKSDIRWYFVINALFLVIMVAYFLIEGWAAYRRAGVLRSIRLFVANWELTPRIIRLQSVLVRRQSISAIVVLYGVTAIVLVIALANLAGMALSGVLLVFLVAALALGLRRERSIEDCFVFLLFATALAISIGTEQVVIDGDVGRMNTIFKFYEQIWVLYGIAGAVAILRIRDWLATVRSHWPGRAWSVVLVAFILMSAVYPVLGTKSRVSQRFDSTIPPTLDGTAYMDSAVYVDTDESSHVTGQLHFVTDKAAIQWLQDHVEGTPTIVEGTRPLYRWGSRISIYTGLPTIIGWDWHQKQQRWGFQNTIDDRIADVQRVYQDPSADRTMALLQQYNVKYVIEGELERAFYPRSSAKFDSMVGSRLSVAYDQSGVKIYQVQ